MSRRRARTRQAAALAVLLLVAAYTLEEMAAEGSACLSAEADAASRERSKVTVESRVRQKPVPSSGWGSDPRADAVCQMQRAD